MTADTGTIIGLLMIVLAVGVVVSGSHHASTGVTVPIGPASGELGPEAIIPGAAPEAAIIPGAAAEAAIIPGTGIAGTGIGGTGIAGTASSTPSAPSLVNPIGKGLTPGRVDMGVDYEGSGVLYALGAGTVTSTTNAGWPGGTFICLRLEDGKYVYYAEDITPAVSVTQTVTAGQVIGTAPGGPSGIEVGWAAPPGTGITMAAATGQNANGLANGDAGDFPTGYGIAMSDLIKSLGGPPGNVNGPVQGAVPAGYG
ncbi:MAG: hypothetical protein JO037_02405 [Actinobacteria bacterium]|nr:hypothetical protein [Actinomycetota bacterium]